MPIPDDIREQLARCCRAKRSRISAFTRKRPVEWRPGTVANPDSAMNLPFTEAGAWEFIAIQLENGHEVNEVTLDKPPGCTGYVLEIAGEDGQATIYIKLEIVGTKVYGRSFHYSTQ